MYVYIIGYKLNNNLYIKIGVSNDIKQRKNQLQTGNPHLLKTYCWCQCNEFAYELETKIHTKLLKFKTPAKNEWFKLNRTIIEETTVILKDCLIDLKTTTEFKWINFNQLCQIFSNKTKVSTNGFLSKNDLEFYNKLNTKNKKRLDKKIKEKLAQLHVDFLKNG